MRMEKKQPVITTFVMLHFFAQESRKPKGMKSKMFKMTSCRIAGLLNYLYDQKGIISIVRIVPMLLLSTVSYKVMTEKSSVNRNRFLSVVFRLKRL